MNAVHPFDLMVLVSMMAVLNYTECVVMCLVVQVNVILHSMLCHVCQRIIYIKLYN